MKGKKKIKNTAFGSRAIKSSKKPASGQVEGKDFVPAGGGRRSSVRTATVDIPGKRGKTDVAIIPTIRNVGGRLVRLHGDAARQAAVQSGDFVRVKGGKTEKKIVKAREKADRKSIKFSKRLGRNTVRATRRSN